MTVEEIFMALAAHMEEGIKVHKDFINVYSFLCLKGYKECHHYHYLSEIDNQQQLYNYYMKHYHKLLNLEQIEHKAMIPSSWYKYTQFDVDTNTTRTAVKSMFEQWIVWEKSTKQLIQNLCTELRNLNELAAMDKFNEFLRDVDKELEDAEEELLLLHSADYDIVHIIEAQKSMYKKYNKKCR